MSTIVPVPAPQLRTLDYSIHKTKQRFGRSDARLEAQIVTEVTDRLRELCAQYPYWFLSVEPGSTIMQGFPYTTAPQSPGTHNWVDRGWLVTTPGVERYPLYTQVDLSTDCCVMVPSECSRMNYVKRYSLQGAMEADLRVVHSDAYLSWGNNQGGANNGLIRGAPYMAFPETTSRQSFLRLNPIPDEQYLMSVSWQLATPPWFSFNNCISNLMMVYYPRVIDCLVGMQYADFFKDSEQYEYHRNQLYGDEMGRQRPGLKNWGIVGQMQRDSAERYSQETGEVEWFESARAAVGRGGAWRRSPADTFYLSPSDYY